MDGAAGAVAKAAQFGRQQAVGNFRGDVLEDVIARGLGEGRGRVAGIGDVAARHRQLEPGRTLLLKFYVITSWSKQFQCPIRRL